MTQEVFRIRGTIAVNAKSVEEAKEKISELGDDMGYSLDHKGTISEQETLEERYQELHKK